MKLKPDKNFPGRKFAYVTFSTVAQAQSAVMLINSPNFMPGFKAARRPQVMRHLIYAKTFMKSYIFRPICMIQIEVVRPKQL